MNSHKYRKCINDGHENRSYSSHGDRSNSFLLYVEFKNEFGSGHTDLEIKTASYYLQSNKCTIVTCTLGSLVGTLSENTLPYAGDLDRWYQDAAFVISSVLIFVFPVDMSDSVPLSFSITREYTASTHTWFSARSPSGDYTNRPALFQAFRAACGQYYPVTNT